MSASVGMWKRLLSIRNVLYKISRRIMNLIVNRNIIESVCSDCMQARTLIFYMVIRLLDPSFTHFLNKIYSSEKYAQNCVHSYIFFSSFHSKTVLLDYLKNVNGISTNKNLCNRNETVNRTKKYCDEQLRRLNLRMCIVHTNNSSTFLDSSLLCVFGIFGWNHLIFLNKILNLLLHQIHDLNVFSFSISI